MKRVASMVLIMLLVVGAGCISSNSGPSTTSLSSPSTSSTSTQTPPGVTTTSTPLNSSHTGPQLSTSNFERVNFSPVGVNLSSRVHVEIDPRLELVQIIYFLSNSDWYRKHASPYRAGANPYNYPYLRDVLNYFGNYTNATAVRMVATMVDNSLAYDAIPEFALHLNPANFSRDMNWSDMLKLRPWLNVTLLNEFARAVAQFANETDFWRFYNEHRAFYNKTLLEFEANGRRILNVTRFEENFFGENISSWTIVPLTLIAYDGFGYHLNEGGKKRIYAFLGFDRIEGGVPRVYLSQTGITFLVHEFAHSFVNPAVDEYYYLFKPYESLYDPVREKLTRMAYPNFKVMLYETFVRAVEAYYLNVTGHPDEALDDLIKNRNLGFYFIGDVYRAYVDDYMKHRDVYKNYTDFMPELARVIEEVYNRTDGGRNLTLPITVWDFVTAANNSGVVISYGASPAEKQLAEFVFESYTAEGIRATIKPVSNLNSSDLRKNLVLVLLSNASVLSKLQENTPVFVNGTTVKSRITGKTYSGNLRVLEVIQNPWNQSALIMLVIGTDEKALKGIHAYASIWYSIRRPSGVLLEWG